MTTDPAPHVAAEVTITAPPDLVWSALRDRAQLRHWHGWDAPTMEAELDEIYFRDAVEADDRRRLTLGNGDAFELVVSGEATVVRITRGPRDPDSPWDAYFEAIDEGWITFAHQLRFALERHRGDVRRTVFTMGTRDAAASPPLGLLSPSGLGRADVGARVDAAVPGEVDAPREVWMAEQHQVGLVVPEWGDGLLVLLALPHDRDGWQCSAVLSTYGLDDVAFEAVDAAWRDWWAERFTPV